MYYLANNGLSFFMHFSIRGVLNRMLDKDAMRIRHTQGVCLSRGRVTNSDEAMDTAGVP